MGKTSELHIEMNEQDVVELNYKVKITWKNMSNHRYTSEEKGFVDEQHWHNFYDKAMKNHSFRKMIGSTVL